MKAASPSGCPKKDKLFARMGRSVEPVRLDPRIEFTRHRLRLGRSGRGNVPAGLSRSPPRPRPGPDRHRRSHIASDYGSDVEER